MSKVKYKIGGFGELEYGNSSSSLHPKALKLQSARSALFLFLSNVVCRKIYIPSYVCDVILPVFKTLKIEAVFYQLDDRMLPDSVDLNSLLDGEFLLLVNYFGLCDKEIESYLYSHDAHRSKVIIDNSQSLFSEPLDCSATVYSPRKFLGIADGGYLYTDVSLNNNYPKLFFDGMSHIDHLYLRMKGEISLGYEKFLASESEFTQLQPLFMSQISESLVDSYDLESIKIARVENYKKLDDEFSKINLSNLSLHSQSVPLCYPLVMSENVTNICRELIPKGIYLPRYWPRSNNYMYENTLFLPIDHRLKFADVRFLIESLYKLLKKYG
ncbi:hypothetical protein [Vibrio sp. TBV020]|uniref:hypothetical protein n=1 Tax=Vibrio sp. TBV020 TaxID=3137398 RepID=UPI0038CDA8EF